MKHIILIVTILCLFCSCVDNSVDSQYVEQHDKPRTLRSLVTKSGHLCQEDSLMVLSKLQSDVDNLMMGRVIQKDGIFVLAIKKDDAMFLGVSEEVYDRYLDYVDRLNAQ